MGDLANQGEQSSKARVGLLYDERMCDHCCPHGENHPENPDRLHSIWKHLLHHDIPQQCVLFNAESVEEKYLLNVHSEGHVKLIKNISSKQYASRRNKIASKLNSIYFNEGSSECALLASGSVVRVSEKVAAGELNSAAALVRPPGHHAEHDEAMGFCLFNNVAVAAKFLLDEKPELGIKKILIVDWDVHHGNGTQKMFYEDPRVLFFSVHRHEHGLFYPGTNDGSHEMIGKGPGIGYNVNVPWDNGRCGDSDYFAAWDHILIPIVKEFDPDIILVSAGFDAAIGDPLGWCCLSPYGYSVLLNKLLDFARGKIVLALEGGYNLDSIAKSFHACMEVLLHKKPLPGSVQAYPFDTTWHVIRQVRKMLSPYWPSLASDLPYELTSKSTPYIHTMSVYSDSDEEGTSVVDSITKPLAGLKVNDSPSDFTKNDVWYAAFGSNMWLPRFRCYIYGGLVEPMMVPCEGSVDKTPIKDICWEVFPRRMFFGGDHSSQWGKGGVAFLHLQSNELEKAHLCLYKITLQQFNDVLLQENRKSVSDSPFVFDSTWQNTIEKRGFIEVFKNKPYGCAGYLGEKDGLPILTITCCWSALEKYKSEERARAPPSPGYKNVLIKGLVEGEQMTHDEAALHVDESATRPL